MPSATHWRLRIFGATPRVAEVSLREVVGGLNSAASATITTSGVASGAIANLTDGAATPEVLLSGNAAWVRAVFAAPVSIVQWGVRMPATGGPDVVALEYSVDSGTSWVPLLPTILTAGAPAGAWVEESSLLTDVVLGAPTPFARQALPPQTWTLALRGNLAAPRRAGWTGPYRVAGTLKIAGTPDTPVARRVLCLDDASMICVGEAWSDPVTGAYEFRNLPAGTFTVLAQDYQGVYNSVVAARVASVP